MTSEAFSTPVMFSDATPGSTLQAAGLQALKLIPHLKAETWRMSLFYFLYFRPSQPAL